MYGEERDQSQHRENGEYRSTLDKAFESWGYNEALTIVSRISCRVLGLSLTAKMTQISTSSRAVTHFAEAYVAAAREQQGSQPIPSRLPTENEVNAMISTGLHVLQKLEEVRDIVQQNRISMERARENGGGPVVRKPLEEEDVPMYSDNIKQPYNMTEVKKRRGVSLVVPLMCVSIAKSNAKIACGSSWTVSQLQPDRHARMAAWPGRRTNTL